MPLPTPNRQHQLQPAIANSKRIKVLQLANIPTLINSESREDHQKGPHGVHKMLTKCRSVITTPRSQDPKIPTFHHYNITTSQHRNIATSQHRNIATSQHRNGPTSLHRTIPASQYPNIPTSRSNSPTSQLPNNPTSQRPNVPTVQNSNSPTSQHRNIATSQHPQLFNSPTLINSNFQRTTSTQAPYPCTINTGINLNHPHLRPNSWVGRGHHGELQIYTTV